MKLLKKKVTALPFIDDKCTKHVDWKTWHMVYETLMRPIQSPLQFQVILYDEY